MSDKETEQRKKDRDYWDGDRFTIHNTEYDPEYLDAITRFWHYLFGY